jgi:hypothetical protein
MVVPEAVVLVKVVELMVLVVLVVHKEMDMMPQLILVAVEVVLADKTKLHKVELVILVEMAVLVS